ncbi:hypothetical protein TGARI_223950 [Toxoplasma gondii ARI]|uniref:Uncharacterized protein n=1 Tax=Toxoplasma gondii ARI TaxID=1074872 RepID=A0A139XTV9_TOXGO|nr:hypothetical protein TGARI_223950 [Toxoplasma gondii ARI]
MPVSPLQALSPRAFPEDSCRAASVSASSQLGENGGFASLPAPTLACLHVLETLGRKRPAVGSNVASLSDEQGASFLSFSEIHQLLLDAEALDTPAKYAHMFHAVCVLADRRLDTVRRRAEAANHFSTAGKKRRRLTADEPAVKREDSTEGEESACGNAEREETLFAEDEDGMAAETKPEGSGRETGEPRRGATEARDMGSTPEETDDAEDSGSDVDACESERNPSQTPRPRERQEVASHVAGLLLGTLESLRRPPALGAEDFLESVTHAISRVLYVHMPAAAGAETEQPDFSAPGPRPAFTSAAECRQAWRRGIIRRFDTVDQLLTQSAPFLCLQEGPFSPHSGEAGSQTPRVTGKERCRRAMRVVRQWAAFLLELEKLRREAVDRIRSTSEEAQGLAHMLFSPDSADAEKKKKTEVLLVMCDDGDESATEEARRKQQEEEALKKASAAASVVTYVTDRMREQEEASAALASAIPGSSQALAALVRQRSISHCFYLLGLNPLTATVPMVEAVKKKWRVLLHPDKFHSIHPHLLHQATEAFKAFQLAVEEAIRTLSQRRVDPSWAQPPPPPDPSASPPPPPAPGISPGSSKRPAPAPAEPAPASPCALPTRQYFPEFSVEVAPRRKALGAFFLYVSAAGPGADPAFSEITEIRVYVHRPMMGGPPGSLAPPAEALSAAISRKVSLVARQREEDVEREEKIEVSDAVQPLDLGEERRYWVGVQVEGKKKDYSLIRWSPVMLRLALPPAVDAACGSADSAKRLGVSGKKDEAGQATAEARALLAFLTSFGEASFLDSRMRAKVDETIVALKRLVRHIGKKKAKKATEGTSDLQGTPLPPELLAEYLATAKEARETLHQCIEKGKTWTSRNS